MSQRNDRKLLHSVEMTSDDLREISGGKGADDSARYRSQKRLADTSERSRQLSNIQRQRNHTAKKIIGNLR